MEIIINYLSNEAYDIFDQIVLKYYIYIYILELKRKNRYWRVSSTRIFELDAL